MAGWSVYSVDVPTRHKATYGFHLAACLLGVSLAGFPPAAAAQGPGAGQPASAEALPATPPPSATAGIFPLSEVHRGLTGVAYTVFEGAKPEPMRVEILGVLRNALGPKQDMILARLEGPKPEYTGVVAGMSGSPVYINGKLLGALSYRIGQFSKQPIAGITPIGLMLAVGGEATAGQRAAAPAADASLDALPGSGPQTGGASPEIHPIETPLVFSGFSPETVKLFGGRFRALGLEPVAGLGGGGGTAGTYDRLPPLEPGSAVSALIVTGDLEMSATCTVTYIDPHQLLACGHPITQFGDVSLPMSKAEVLATLASPLNSFKIINTEKVVGSFTQDRASAIRGVLGEPARMIPVAIRVHKGDRETALHLEVADNADLTPGALMASLYQAMMQSNSYGAEMTYAVKGTVALHGYPALRLDSFLAPTAQAPSALSTAVSVGRRFLRIYASPARLGEIESVSLDVTELPGRRSMQLESARAAIPVARAGDTVMIEASLRPYQGAAKNVRIPVRLPVGLPVGPLRILLSDGGTLDRLLDGSPGLKPPANLNETIRQMNAEHEGNRLYVTLLTPHPQAVLDGHTMTSIPLSMANVLDPLRASRQMSLNGESAVPVTSVPMQAMVTGEQVVTVEVE